MAAMPSHCGRVWPGLILMAPMNLKSITTRPAAPTPDDGLLFAEFANDIARGAFAKLFGREYDRILARSFVEPHHEMSYQTTTFAEHEGSVVGMVSAYVPGPDAPPPWDHLRLEPGGQLRRGLAVAMLRSVKRSFTNHDDDSYYVHFLGVTARYRGNGIGTCLMKAAESRAREAGVARFRLDVEGRNSGARRLYERFGLRVVSRYPRLALIPPIVLGMMKEL